MSMFISDLIESKYTITAIITYFEQFKKWQNETGVAIFLHKTPHFDLNFAYK